MLLTACDVLDAGERHSTSSGTADALRDRLAALGLAPGGDCLDTGKPVPQDGCHCWACARIDRALEPKP